MSYLKDFLKCIANHDYPSFFKIWEEYCSGDDLDVQEVLAVLQNVKGASFSNLFEKDVTMMLPLWETVRESEGGHEVFKRLVDLFPARDVQLGEMVFEYLKNRYGQDLHFQEKIRLIGLRNKDKPQGAVTNYELLSHIEKGNFFFHTAGWGVGMVLDYSLVREQVSLEFDYVAGKKDLSFEMVFRTLIPVNKTHFLARRFGAPDDLEALAKENPVEVMHLLLRDLGPKNAAEIKDELCELVIPEGEWTKWWQSARAKMKKDTMIEVPEDLKSPFRLRQAAVTHEERLQKALENKPGANTIIQMIHGFMKDFPEALKNKEFKENLIGKLQDLLEYPEVLEPQKVQIHFFLQELRGDKKSVEVEEILKQFGRPEDLLKLLEQIEILSCKKKVLMEVRQLFSHWQEIFTEILLLLDQSTLRDYVLGELLVKDGDTSKLESRLLELSSNPSKYPEVFVWYFQKIMGPKSVPFSDKEGKIAFFEAFFILLSSLDGATEFRDLVKKMHNILTDGRYAVVRQLMQEANLEQVREFLLLATKCRSLDDHDIKIFHSLAEVAHPALGKSKKGSKKSSSDEIEVIWTTEEGYAKLKQRIQQIATVETVENAKEIETARAHGDLRENAEFKAALERRDRLQGELKTLSDQMNLARVLTKQDIDVDEVGIGTVVSCKSDKGVQVVYTLLGPWDADPEKNILAFQSKLAQAMRGLKVGDSFEFQGDKFSILQIKSYL